MNNYFITGTDTGVGKTIAAAWACLHLGADYWKPTQSGLEEIDSDVIAQLGIKTHPETHRLTQPLSPHEAAKRDGVQISLADFALPSIANPLIVEGAGGALVPLNDEDFVIDLIKHLGLPAIVVCRSGLGTINHTLLTLEALRSRQIPIAGLIINGEKSPNNREALQQFGKTPILAELPILPKITSQTLLAIKPEMPF